MNDLRARIQLVYRNQDVTRDVSPCVESVEFTDSLDKADDLQITLADPDRLWIRTWAPTAGAVLELTIYQRQRQENGTNGTDGTYGERALPCGRFHLDTCSSGGGSVTIKGTSADLSIALRKTDHTRAWEHASLVRVLSDVAKGAGLTLQWLGHVNPTYKRIEQRRESDMAFVTRIANNEDLLVKVIKGTLVVTAPSDYEASAPVMKLGIDDARVVSWDLETQVVDSYSGVLVKYRHAKEHKVHEYLLKIPGAPEGSPTLHINKRCESVAQAQRMAKAALGQNHRSLSGGSITLLGNTAMLAGLNIELDASWGIHAGKYSLPEVKHTLWPYQTVLTPRGVYTVE